MILAGTGHRPEKLGGFSDDAFRMLVDVAAAALRELRPEAVISGMALGWDQALATAAVEVGIPFDAAIPFQGQESIWPEASQVRYRELLDKAREVVYVCGPGYAAWKMQRRNEWMCDHATGLLVIHNGDKHGGTWNCLEYARVVGKPVTRNCYEDWLKVTERANPNRQGML
jgi:uncharacterized phage-like protein YoqJ